MTQEFTLHPTVFLGIKYQQSMKKKIHLLEVVVFSLLLTNCAADPQRQAFTYAEKGGNEISEEVLGKWNRSCALCHINGEAGAPIIGDTNSWSERTLKGEDALIRSVLEGLNSMPPLGYCMACELEDFKSMVDFMVGSG